MDVATREARVVSRVSRGRPDAVRPMSGDGAGSWCDDGADPGSSRRSRWELRLGGWHGKRPDTALHRRWLITGLW